MNQLAEAPQIHAAPAARPALAGIDVRLPFGALLAAYALLGCTVLRFNRNPLQMLMTVAGCALLDGLLHRVLRGQWRWPWSALISGLSLALLLNYSHNYYLLFLPVFLTVASKYLLTFNGRHHFNPSLLGVVGSLLLGGDLITTAAAYQWGGTWAMSFFLAAAAMSLFVFRIGRGVLIGSFLGFYVLQIGFRAWLLRHHLPPETLLLGTLTSTPFFLFVFYMITDPKTSPPGARAQFWTGLALVLVDLVFHLVTSLYTFFYAGFVVATARFLFLHGRRLMREGWQPALSGSAAYWRGVAVLAALALAMAGAYAGLIAPRIAVNPPFRFETLGPGESGIASRSDPAILDQVDPRVRHIAKWLLSVGDAAATADFDNDGLLDLFLTNPLKSAADRCCLYRNTGSLRFERVPLPALEDMRLDPAHHGLPAGAVFADYDNDGDQDLLVTAGYGHTRLLQNQLIETGQATFTDVTAAAGIDEFTVSVAANFFDFDRDGRLDLFIANAFNPRLEQYQPPRPLNIFALPAAEFPGDRRMLPFMHASWDNAENGGLNVLYRNLGNGRFEKMDITKIGMPETHWSLAVGTGDLNNDGWTDLYIANDFGPDDCYLNEPGGTGRTGGAGAGRHFRRVSGRLFGSIGKDTYKGMNTSLGDLDRNGWLDVYVSNVHVPLQAEGSLLWMTYPPAHPGGDPEFRDEATQRGALNEHYFGWGAAMGDLDLDGWLDLAQANGMVDDAYDHRFEKPKNYWYVNEKLMRAGPEIHAYADRWGDLRGYVINGWEPNRIYLSRGARSRLQFADAAAALGLTEKTNSRGMLLADFDNDGDLDLAVTHEFAPLSFYRNTLAQKRWIGFAIRGDGVGTNRDAAGARIEIRYSEQGRPATQFREITLTNAFAAQGDRRALFGLANAGDKVEAAVIWTGGARQELGPLEQNRYHTIEMKTESNTP